MLEIGSFCIACIANAGGMAISYSNTRKISDGGVSSRCSKSTRVVSINRQVRKCTGNGRMSGILQNDRLMEYMEITCSINPWSG